MPETHSLSDVEIDLVEIFQTLWHGKWIILATVLFFLLAVIGYLSFNKTDFKITTEIKPIPSTVAEMYLPSNNLGFFEVTSDLLLSKYIEQLNEKKVFEEAILKYELLDAKDFEDEQTFNDEVIKFASEIKIRKIQDIVDMNWVIEAEYNNQHKWKQLLSYVNSSTNVIVKNLLQKSFENSLATAKQQRDFKLEDIDTKIKNASLDYERKTTNRLFFLREQAAIARKLGVAKNTLEAQPFGIQNSIIASVQTAAPFYLNGYYAIEKEINLIETRQNKEAFTADLLPLQQEQRALKQDVTYERAETEFNNTPIIKDDDFFAASIKVGATEFKPKTGMIVMLSLGALLGGIIASFYVLISNAIRRRKDNSVKA